MQEKPRIELNEKVTLKKNHLENILGSEMFSGSIYSDLNFLTNLDQSSKYSSPDVIQGQFLKTDYSAQTDDIDMNKVIVHNTHKSSLNPKSGYKKCFKKVWSKTNQLQIQKNKRNKILFNNCLTLREQWCNCYGINNMMIFFLFAKLMYETSQRLQYITQSTKYVLRGNMQSNFFIISVEMSHLQKLLNPPECLPIQEQTHKNLILHEERIFDIKNKPFTLTQESSFMGFNIAIEKQNMKFNIAISKFESMSTKFLQTVEAFFSVAKTIAGNYKANNVPSLCVKNWCFHNMIQGYIMAILLKKSNINTLNIMRNLYFIIITSSTPNLIIEINIRLKNGVFMVYDNDFYQDINLFKSNQYHQKSVSTATLENLIKKRFNKIYQQEKHFKAITYINSYHSELNICEKFNCISQAESNEDIYDGKICFDCESLETKLSRSSTFSLHKIDGVTTLVIENIDIDRSDLKSQVNGDTIINNIFEDNHTIYKADYLHSKQWLTKIFKAKKEITANNKENIYNYQSLKEALCDANMIQKYLQSIVDLYWKHVTSQTFYTFILKSLRQSVTNIIFSSVV